MKREPKLSMAEVMLPNLEQFVKDELNKLFESAIKLAEAEERHAL